jgi:dTDP-4-amino-4,6-dideoxygalactose transaminase
MIKFLDLQAINKLYQPELETAIRSVLDSGYFILGDQVKSFESEYASYIGTKYCIGVSNGLDALRIILRGYIELGVMKKGDEVIVPANTFIATILAITENDLRPVLIEPDIQTYNINPYLIEERINEKTKAIIIVHLYGRNSMHPEIDRIVKKYDIKLIEDNAQSQGCFYGTERTGSIGDAAGHSFYPGKNLGAIGDAGAITTNNLDLSNICRTISNYGSKKKYNNDLLGLNSRLDEIQAAVLRVKLKFLDNDNNNRKKVADFYLRNIDNSKFVIPCLDDNFSPTEFLGHVWHLFVIRSSKRSALQDYMTLNGIQTVIHYPTPPHKQRCYSKYFTDSLPVTELIHDQVLSLPISPIIKKAELEIIVNTINKFNS